MKYSECNKTLCMETWKTPVYVAQCKTFDIAKTYTNKTGGVCTVEQHLKPPFCLRVVKRYRTPEMQKFRDTIARITWNIRKCA